MRKKDRCRVTLDTSVIVSALWRNGSQRVVHLWKHGFLQLIVAADLVEEYLHVLESMGVAPHRLERWHKWFTHPSKTTLVTPGRRFKICRDPNDDMFLDAAIAGRTESDCPRP
jgi:putative PIN family toxin of toxin-antitoxin system